MPCIVKCKSSWLNKYFFRATNCDLNLDDLTFLFKNTIAIYIIRIDWHVNYYFVQIWWSVCDYIIITIKLNSISRVCSICVCIFVFWLDFKFHFVIAIFVIITIEQICNRICIVYDLLFWVSWSRFIKCVKAFNG